VKERRGRPLSSTKAQKAFSGKRRKRYRFLLKKDRRGAVGKREKVGEDFRRAGCDGRGARQDQRGGERQTS